MPAYDFLNGSVPMPNVENLKRQAKLYLRWHREGEPLFYAQVVRAGTRLNLRHVDRPLFLEFQHADVVFHQTLRTELWGAHLHRARPRREPDRLRGWDGLRPWAQVGTRCASACPTPDGTAATQQVRSCNGDEPFPWRLRRGGRAP